MFSIHSISPEVVQFIYGVRVNRNWTLYMFVLIFAVMLNGSKLDNSCREAASLSHELQLQYSSFSLQRRKPGSAHRGSVKTTEKWKVCVWACVPVIPAVLWDCDLCPFNPAERETEADLLTWAQTCRSSEQAQISSIKHSDWCVYSWNVCCCWACVLLMNLSVRLIHGVMALFCLCVCRGLTAGLGAIRSSLEFRKEEVKFTGPGNCWRNSINSQFAMFHRPCRGHSSGGRCSLHRRPNLDFLAYIHITVCGRKLTLHISLNTPSPKDVKTDGNKSQRKPLVGYKRLKSNCQSYSGMVYIKAYSYVRRAQSRPKFK